MNKRLAQALGIGTSSILGAALIGWGAADANTSHVTPQQDAIAQLDIAQKAIDRARNDLLNGSTKVTTTTPTSTTKPPPTTTTTTSSGPVPVIGTSAGQTQNWGTPNAQFSDEFNTNGSPDPARWNNSPASCMSGNGNNGKRCGGNATVNGGFLTERGDSNGNTGWLESRLDQKYGKWELRMRLSPAIGNGHPYHPVLILWTDKVKWPQGGEEDYTEVNIGDTKDVAFMHHPTTSGTTQDYYGSAPLDMTQWHYYGFEWNAAHLIGYIDGVKWFDDSDPSAQPPLAMHQTIQLDNNNGAGMMPATMDVDSFHVYT